MMAREGRFLEALGIDPGEAIAESVHVKFLSGHTAQVTWTGAKVVTLAELSRVFSEVDFQEKDPGITINVHVPGDPDSVAADVADRLRNINTL